MVGCVGHLFLIKLEKFSPLLIHSSGDMFQLMLIQLIILQKAYEFPN